MMHKRPGSAGAFLFLVAAKMYICANPKKLLH